MEFSGCSKGCWAFDDKSWTSLLLVSGDIDQGWSPLHTCTARISGSAGWASLVGAAMSFAYSCIALGLSIAEGEWVAKHPSQWSGLVGARQPSDHAGTLCDRVARTSMHLIQGGEDASKAWEVPSVCWQQLHRPPPPAYPGQP